LVISHRVSSHLWRRVGPERLRAIIVMQHNK
jgi:hypothetical protein